MQSMKTLLRQLRFALLGFVATSAIALAQAGTLTGRVTEAASGAPLKSATVRIVAIEGSREGGAITDASGQYTIKGLPPGRYRVTVTYISYALFESEVTVAEGATATLDAKLVEGALGIGEVVVSASRRPEKLTDAPASVSVVSAREIEQQPALTLIDHVREIAGVDIVQSGLTQSNVVVRGFNNIFSGSLMTLIDNRIASVPSLRLNAYNFIPIVNEDVQQIEVIRGPGAALYGPNTANGVMHTITRSPFSSAGTWLSLAGGERDLVQGMVRHAGTLGDRVGYKVSAQYMTGTDWGFTDTAEVAARAVADSSDPNFVRIGIRDSSIERFGGEVRFDFLPVEDMTAVVAVGMNQAVRNTDVTGLGAAQVRDWRYTYYQARVNYKDLFVQGFINQSDAGESYLIRTGEPVVDRSMLYAAQVQHSYAPIEDLSLTYGADLIVTTPVTDSTITGRNEEDDNTTEIGGYLQGEANVVDDLLSIVAAIRADKHSRLDDIIISPRAALVATPFENQSLRLTYNRAYSAPTTNELFLDIVGNRSLLFDVRGSGVPQSGYTFDFTGGRHTMYVNSLSPDGTHNGAALPLGNDPALWDLVRQVIKANPDTSAIATQLKQYADVIPPPPTNAVGVELRMLNSSSGTFDAYTAPDGRVPDRSSVRPTINQTIELGYKGVIADRVVLSVDLYRSQYTDFVGPLEVITPSVFYNRTQLAGYLKAVFMGGGMSEEQATLYSEIAALKVSGIAGDKTEIGIPLATVTPTQASDPRAVMLTYRNYGDVTLYGYDIGLQIAVMNGLAINGSLSYVDKNFFENLDRVADLSLNAPKFKFTIGAEYDNPELGFNGNVRLRHADGFPVRSGVYVGAVKGYSVVDLTLGYRLPWVEGLGLAVSAQNLLTFVEDGEEGAFDQRHSEFVGVPALGRLVVARLTYSFK
jgi:outer membrane receptor for ferrienterochelin and colicins